MSFEGELEAFCWLMIDSHLCPHVRPITPAGYLLISLAGDTMKDTKRASTKKFTFWHLLHYSDVGNGMSLSLLQPAMKKI